MRSNHRPTQYKILVRIKEHQPLARWKDQGFLTHSGHLIYPKKSELDFNLITLRGPEESKFILLDYSRELEKQLNDDESSANSELKGVWVAVHWSPSSMTAAQATKKIIEDKSVEEEVTEDSKSENQESDQTTEIESESSDF